MSQMLRLPARYVSEKADMYWPAPSPAKRQGFRGSTTGLSGALSCLDVELPRALDRVEGLGRRPLAGREPNCIHVPESGTCAMHAIASEPVHCAQSNTRGVSSMLKV